MLASFVHDTALLVPIRVYSRVFVAKMGSNTDHAHDTVSLKPEKPSGLIADC
jgi:hypothetical protein